MSAIPATFIDGTIIPDVTPDWPNWARLVVETVSVPPVRMMTEDEQGDDPESIARYIAWADSLQPLVMTPEEVAEWEQARAEHKAWELDNWEAHSKKIEDLLR